MFEQKEFNKAFIDVINSMVLLANKEELQIGKFIGVTQKTSYKLIQFIKWPVYLIIILAMMVVSILNLEWDWVDLIGVIIFYIFQQIGMRYIGYSYSFYSVVRNRFMKYQKQLKLITNNSHFYNYFNLNEELRTRNDLINQKFDYIIKVLKTPLDYIKSFQILGILGIIISIFIPLFQDILVTINFSNYIFDILGLIFLIFVLYLYPVILYNKSAGFKKYRKNLRNKLKNLRKIQASNLIDDIQIKNNKKK